MKFDTWIAYTLLAGLSWGVYVPLIFYGGSELGGAKPGANARLLAILCVGIAYFVIAVLLPLGLFLSKQYEWPPVTTRGLLFSGGAGIAGAVGAICVIFATQAAVASARQQDLPVATYKLYIAPLIFGLAPVINTLVSLIWHPKAGEPWHFGLKEMPSPLLFAGIVLVGLGAALVLYSKELTESTKATPAPKAVETSAGSAS